MKVFKFGGASVKDAQAVRNVAHILEGCCENLVVVISAMGKMTNLLEKLTKAYFEKSTEEWKFFQDVKDFHLEICTDLFGEGQIPETIQALFSELNQKLHKSPSLDFNFEYDQVVSYGELISTRIVSEYLELAEVRNRWIDVRTCLRTNNVFRDASVDWQLTEKLVPKAFNFGKGKLFVTQGFIGATTSNLTTTLGREGSDFTAAILGNVLNAENVSFWKDVPGILNADPKKMEETVKIKELSYREAIEMSYSGAQVIHPKTMKPLHNKKIPLLVKSFVNPTESGSVIHKVNHQLQLQPVFIAKENQVLITISPNDFSFISIEDINHVVTLLLENRIKVNLIQQSAIDFNLVVDSPEVELAPLLQVLSKKYIARYNTGLTLHTIRHYTHEAIRRMKKNKKIYLEQSSRLTARLLVRE
ncbi:MAG: aspartate kinase [Prolixibacteraceae bacterium]|nr:aspartate kinase [Prolixibacteraceae bacterium]